MADDGSVKVFCRVRPPNEREGGATPFTKKCVTVPSADPLQQTVQLQLKGTNAPKTFTFDRVFHEMTSQNEVFELVGVPITRACLEGYNGTIFAYGQTGSGKTFTMQGPDDVIDADARLLSDKERGLRGLVPRVFDYLFQYANSAGPLRVATDATQVEHTFACSFLEIYNERVYDLLDHGSTRDAAGLTLRENGRKGVSVEGLIESVVTNARQAAELMAVGARNRRVGQTAMNRESSRSHSVFVLQIQSKETTAEGITRTRLSRFNLVDLAGSERQKNTHAADERLKEAGSINKSLSALGNVIKGLGEQSAGKNRHVHYRDSKLTFLLKDSLGGNSKTFMIATVSPADDSSHETLSTLQFAQRAKLIRNNAVINEDTSGSVLVLQEEILRLRRQLQEAKNGHSTGSDLVGEARFASAHNQHSLTADGAHGSDALIGGLSERLEELEASLSFALEKNESLMRTNGQLSVRSGHMQALCSELKRNVSSLKLRLRLRGGSECEDIADYDSSADAIEWRMKYEELEEAFTELQDRLRASGSSDSEDSGGEAHKLSLMYQTLAKQFALVIREKQDISRRLKNTSVVPDDADDRLARIEAEMADRSIEFDSKLNSVLTANVAAEAKAEAASLELLHSKQKEAAWKIDQQQSHAVIAQLQESIAQLQADVRVAQAAVVEEKQQRVEFEMSLMREHANRVQDLESQLAEKMTENFELARAQEKLQSNLQETLMSKKAMEQGIVSLNEAKTELAETVLVLKTELSGKETQNSELLDEVRQLEGIKSELELNLEQTKGSLDSEQRARCVAEANLAATSESLLQTKSDNENLRATVDGLKLDATKMADRIGTLQEELSKSSELLKVTEGVLRDCKEEMAKRADEHNAKISALKSECADLDAQRERAIADSNEAIAVLQERHRTEIEELNSSAEKAVCEHKTRVEQLRAEIVGMEKRLGITLQEHQELVGGLRRKQEALETSLATEKQLRVNEREDGQRQREELVLKHTDEVKLLTETTTQQKKKDDATISALTRVVEGKSKTILERDATIVELGKKISMLENELNRAESICNELRDALRTAEVERDKLYGRCDVLEKKLATETTERRAAEGQVQDLTDDVAAQKEKIRECEDRITSGLKQIEDLEGQLGHAKKDIEKLSADAEQAHHAFDEAAITHKCALAKLEDSHKTEIERLSSESRSKIEKLEKTLESLRADIDTKVGEIERLHDTVKSQISTIARVEGELASEREHKTVAQGELAEVKSELQGRDSIIVEKNDEIARANHQLELMQEEAKEERVRLSGQIQLLEADLKDLTRAHDVLTSSHSTLMKLQKDTVTEKCQVEKANAEHLQENEDLRNQVGDLQTRNASLLATMKQLESEVEVQGKDIKSLKQKKEEADVVVAELKRLIAQRDDELDEKDSFISGMEETIENLEADKERGADELRKIEVTLHNLKKEYSSTTEALENTKATLRDVKSRLASVTSELNSANDVISSQKIEIQRDAEQVGRLSKELEESKSAFNSTIKELQQRVDEERQKAEELKKEAAETRRTLESDIAAVRQELDHSSEKVSRQRKRNETLVESNAQLSQDLKEQSAAAAKQRELCTQLEEKFAESQKRQFDTDRELQQAMGKLSATKSELSELEMKYKELSNEFDSVREDLKRKQADWEKKDKELQGRMSVVGEMEVQIADESKKLTDEKVLVAQRKKEAERIKREYEQYKSRVEELETLKIQLSKEKEKYRREVNILTLRLDQISKENDKLVGHDNKRQKIQHHIKVKEENNRLQAEVRLLTEEKLKLQVRIERLALSLKEKENLVNDVQIDTPRSPSSSKSSASIHSGSQSVSSTATSFTAKTAESGSVESSARKRLRSLNQ